MSARKFVRYSITLTLPARHSSLLSSVSNVLVEAAYTFGFKESYKSKDRIPSERVYVQRRKKAALVIKTAVTAERKHKK